MWTSLGCRWVPAGRSVPRLASNAATSLSVVWVKWSDVHHQGGATLVAADSVRPVARFLADHPEGVYPLRPAEGEDGDPDAVLLPYEDLSAECHEFIEATGEVGDVYLLHPFVLHAESQNVLRIPCPITNPPLTLAEPMRFARPTIPWWSRRSCVLSTCPGTSSRRAG